MGKMDATPIVVGGIAAGLWAMMAGKPSPAPSVPTPAAIATQAVQVAQQQVAAGVPPQQAAASAAVAIQTQISKIPPPPPLPVMPPGQDQMTPSGPILSLNDPRIAEASAMAKSGGSFAWMASISAIGMPTAVSNALISQGWTWTGTGLNDRQALVPPPQPTIA